MNDGYELYVEGRELFNGGDLSAAAEKFSESAKASPHFKSYEMMYRCYSTLGEREKAFMCLEKAHALNKRHDKVSLLYAMELAEYKGDVNAALALLDEIVKRNPTYKPAERLLDKLDRGEATEK